MFERFSDESRRAVAVANMEARRLRHGQIQTAHVLLGIAAAGGGVARALLDRHGLTPERLRAHVATLIPAESGRLPERLPQTFGFKRAIERAIEETWQLSAPHVGTDELFAGLLALGDPTAACALAAAGVDAAALLAKARATPGVGMGETPS